MAVLLMGKKPDTTVNDEVTKNEKTEDKTKDKALSKYTKYEGEKKTYDLSDNKTYEAPEGDDSYRVS
ncbi:MAG: hypothetical protein K6G26_09730, partial [Lachnospiraceae bacterium]|nr:hypothetical protein [Lachnospiraceae bacterium]